MLNKSAFNAKNILDDKLLNDSNDRHKYLRQAAAQYVLKHENTFAPFLALEDNPEPFVEYCKRMETSSDWGGQIELQALSEILKCKIEIFSATSPKLVIGNESFQPTIRLSYHQRYYALGNHYNSLY